MLCPFCKEEILDGAIKCKHCGSMLVPSAGYLGKNAVQVYKENGTIGFAVASMTAGIVVLLACIATERWDKDAAMGGIALSFISLGLGIGSLSHTKRGRGMAITGIILGSLCLLISAGNL